MPTRRPAITGAERRKGDRRKTIRRQTSNFAIVKAGTIERGGIHNRALDDAKINIGRRNWDNQMVWPPEFERRNYIEPGKITIMGRRGPASGLKPGDQATTTRREFTERGSGDLTVERRKDKRRKGERRKNIKLREQINEFARRNKGVT